MVKILVIHLNARFTYEQMSYCLKHRMSAINVSSGSGLYADQLFFHTGCVTGTSYNPVEKTSTLHQNGNLRTRQVKEFTEITTKYE